MDYSLYTCTQKGSRIHSVKLRGIDYVIIILKPDGILRPDGNLEAASVATSMEKMHLDIPHWQNHVFTSKHSQKCPKNILADVKLNSVRLSKMFFSHQAHSGTEAFPLGLDTFCGAYFSLLQYLIGPVTTIFQSSSTTNPSTHQPLLVPGKHWRQLKY
ncbi:hypothetical protein VP01_2829g2 [Puccinia sorghi]|uniref:Uncharacterized protein n=1 Tax=Puccinia sorghi TaxID=27349 RepID=A0A0L6V417_9BASI|nr:hypothetical protein VP01_2829g2 [Puccinia sorghi]